MAQSHDHTGKTVAGRYTLLGRVGDGAFGDVYKATDTRLDRVCAVKLIKPWWASDEEWSARFAGEAKVAAKIDHPNVVRVTDAGTDKRLGLYVVSEFVDGEPLDALLSRQGKVGVARTTEIVADLLKALEAAHEVGIVHRDIKPANVLISSRGEAKLTDFGIARLPSGATRSSALHTMVGTPHYMAPEQASGKATTSRSDLYAVGVLLFQMLVGRLPFGGSTPVEIALAHIQADAPEVPSTVPRYLRDLIRDALSKDPEGRPDTARSMMTRLIDPEATLVLDDDSTVPLPRDEPEAVDPTVVASRSTRSGAWPGWAPAAIVILILGAMIGLANWLDRDPDLIGDTASGGGEAREESGLGSDQAEDPVPRRRVPKLTGQSEGPALRRIRGLGLDPTIHRPHDSSVPKGIVIKAFPVAGRSVELGSEVDVYISDGPPPVSVPDVRGLDIDSAEIELRDLGFRVTRHGRSGTGQSVGSVLSQDPSAGASRAPGSSVALAYAEAPRWTEVQSFSMDAEGSLPAITIRAEGRLRYSLSVAGCKYELIGCSKGPSLSISAPGGGFSSPSLTPGDHEINLPAAGSYSIQLSTLSSHYESFAVQFIVEEFR